MNSKTKLIISAVALSIAGTANAGIKVADKGSELFISMLRDVSGQEKTIVLDTGIKMRDLVANPNSFNGWTLGNGGGANVNVGTVITDFIGLGPTVNDFKFNSGAADTTSSSLGVVTTASVLDSFPPSGSGLNTAAATVGAHIFNLNSAYGDGVVANQQVYSDAGDGLGIEAGDAGEHNDSSWGQQFGATFTGNTNTEGGMNTALNTYWFHLDQAGNTLYELIGTWTVSSSNGTAVFNASSTPPPAVPVPAAVWLLGSALIGMVGVARRRVGA